MGESETQNKAPNVTHGTVFVRPPSKLSSKRHMNVYDYVVSLTVTCLDSVAVTILSRRLGR